MTDPTDEKYALSLVRSVHGLWIRRNPRTLCEKLGIALAKRLIIYRRFIKKLEIICKTGLGLELSINRIGLYKL
jgi:hypothetical protein